MTFIPPECEPGKLNAYCDMLDDALEKGFITEAEWYAYRRSATAEAYLSGENPRAQSGHGGDEARWRYTRVLMVLEGIRGDGAFLDVGCANGYLVECLLRWVTGSGMNISFYGVDIAEALIETARRRLPDLADHFFTANAVEWTPPQKFDTVHAHEISYAPRNRERDFFEHLLHDYLNPGGRLIIGPWAQGRDCTDLEDRLAAWGYTPTGSLTKTWGTDPGMNRRMIWFDRN